MTRLAVLVSVPVVLDGRRLGSGCRGRGGCAGLAPCCQWRLVRCTRARATAHSGREVRPPNATGSRSRRCSGRGGGGGGGVAHSPYRRPRLLLFGDRLAAVCVPRIDRNGDGLVAQCEEGGLDARDEGLQGALCALGGRTLLAEVGADGLPSIRSLNRGGGQEGDIPVLLEEAGCQCQ